MVMNERWSVASSAERLNAKCKPPLSARVRHQTLTTGFPNGMSGADGSRLTYFAPTTDPPIGLGIFRPHTLADGHETDNSWSRHLPAACFKRPSLYWAFDGSPFGILHTLYTLPYCRILASNVFEGEAAPRTLTCLLWSQIRLKYPK